MLPAQPATCARDDRNLAVVPDVCHGSSSFVPSIGRHTVPADVPCTANASGARRPRSPDRAPRPARTRHPGRRTALRAGRHGDRRPSRHRRAGGLGLAAVILLTVTSLVDFMEYAATPVVAYLHGAGRPDDARRAAGDAVALAGLLGTVVAAVLALAAEPLVHVLGGRGDVADNAVLYLRIMSIGLPFALVVLAGHGVMRGVNQLTKPLVIVAVANALNLVLEIVAVYVLHWGIAGISVEHRRRPGAVGRVVPVDHAAAPHRDRTSVAPVPAVPRHGLPPRPPGGSDVRGLDHLHRGRRSRRHADARRQPGRESAVHVPRPVVGRDRHPGPVAGGRRARQGRPARGGARRATRPPGCRSGRGWPSPCRSPR